MFKSYDEAVSWIKGKSIRGIDLGLKRVEWMLHRLENPEKKVHFIHIGGTNGKGSTLAMLQSILLESGYSTGSFTSPSIEGMKEHIHVNGEPISETEFIHLANVVKQVTEEFEAETGWSSPTEFEILTVMMFYFFAYMRKVDFVLLEVGLGGENDSTNVVQPLIAIITNVSLDHTNILGSTTEQIAVEKAGIIKENGLIITGCKDKEAIKIIRKKAALELAELFVLGENFTFQSQGSKRIEELFSYTYNGHTINNLSLKMMGTHQVENASIAITASLLLRERFEKNITENTIRKGLKKANLKGRFEMISHDPCIILDGAHNEASIHSLVSTLRTHFKNEKFVFVIAALKDKNYKKMLSMLDDIADCMIFTQIDMDRALSAQDLAKASKAKERFIFENWEEAVQKGIELANDGKTLIVTGSLYFLYYARPYLKEHYSGM